VKLVRIRVPFGCHWRWCIVDDEQPRIGTMTDRGGGRWRLQVAVDPDPVSGERRRLSRTVQGTRSEAKDVLQRMVVDAGGGLYGGGRVTLGDLLDQFLASATLGPTTRADWVSVTERHLKPVLGEMPLWKLTSRDCDQLYARMKAAGLGQSRVRCAHVVLHRAVAQAVRWGWLARNPVSNATRPPVARVTISPPGIDDVRAALAASRAGPVEGRCVRSDGAMSTSTSALFASSGRSRQPLAPAWSSSAPRLASLESCRSRHRLSRR
jgi:hypothetical protein